MFAEPPANKPSHGKRKRRRRPKQQRLRTPAPVPGRKHMQIQTSRYLEEISIGPAEATTSTQTDAMLDYPEPPLFVPQSSGITIATQIQPGDLFDFDLEVIPLLETLVGKCLDIAMMEVCEEEELKALRHHQEMYEQRRNAELTECQRLQEKERRLFEEKERRKQQARIYKEQKAKEDRAREAKLLAKEKQQDLKNNVFSKLQSKRLFDADPISEFLSQTFMQDVYKRVSELLQPKKIAIGIANEILTLAVEALRNKKKDAIINIKEELERRAREEAELNMLRFELEKELVKLEDTFEAMKEEEYLGFELSALLGKEEEEIQEIMQEINIRELLIEGKEKEMNKEMLTKKLVEIRKYQQLFELRSSGRSVLAMLNEMGEEDLPGALVELDVEGEGVSDFQLKYIIKEVEGEMMKSMNTILREFLEKRKVEEETPENDEPVEDEEQ